MSTTVDLTALCQLFSLPFSYFSLPSTVWRFPPSLAQTAMQASSYISFLPEFLPRQFLPKSDSSVLGHPVSLRLWPSMFSPEYYENVVGFMCDAVKKFWKLSTHGSGIECIYNLVTPLLKASKDSQVLQNKIGQGLAFTFLTTVEFWAEQSISATLGAFGYTPSSTQNALLPWITEVSTLASPVPLPLYCTTKDWVFLNNL